MTNGSSWYQCSHVRGRHRRAFLDDCFPPERSGVQTPSAVAPRRHLGWDCSNMLCHLGSRAAGLWRSLLVQWRFTLCYCSNSSQITHPLLTRPRERRSYSAPQKPVRFFRSTCLACLKGEPKIYSTWGQHICADEIKCVPQNTALLVGQRNVGKTYWGAAYAMRGHLDLPSSLKWS